MSTKLDFPYADIVNLPTPQPKRHRRMSMMARAAQFAPFAALTGYEDAVEETARYIEQCTELDNDQKIIISEALTKILERLPEPCSVAVCYFQEDPVKRGGMYHSYTGRVKKVDPYKGILVFVDGLSIAFDDILSLQEVLPECD